jgi:hypothetical protein
MAASHRRRCRGRARRRRRRESRWATLTLLSLIAVAVAVAVAVATGEGDDSTTTTPPESTAAEQPTTTAAAAPVAGSQVVAIDDSGSRYLVTESPFTVQLSFAGPCWVEVRRAGSEGEVLASGAFEPGDTPVFTESAIWIRLGYPPSAIVTVNGVTLPPTGATADPRNIEIAAGSAAD